MKDSPWRTPSGLKRIAANAIAEETRDAETQTGKAA